MLSRKKALKLEGIFLYLIIVLSKVKQITVMKCFKFKLTALEIMGLRYLNIPEISTNNKASS